MLKAMGMTHDDRPVFLIGLSDLDWRNLRIDEKAIVIPRENTSLPADIFIVGTETDEELKTKLKDRGVVTADTEIRTPEQSLALSIAKGIPIPPPFSTLPPVVH